MLREKVKLGTKTDWGWRCHRRSITNRVLDLRRLGAKIGRKGRTRKVERILGINARRGRKGIRLGRLENKRSLGVSFNSLPSTKGTTILIIIT